MKISFIGFGNMAKALAQSLLGNDNYHLFAAAPSLRSGVNADGIITSANNLEIIAEADVIILAVKPVKMATVLQQINNHFPSHCLLVSIAAGLSLSWLEKYCGKQQAIVRTMPNTPVAIGKGATPLIANSHATAKHKQWAEQLFQCSGLIHWTTKEDELNLFTALSGSGPAYVFIFLEAMIKAATKLGLDEEIAKLFSLQTMHGALGLIMNSGLEISELRKNVTSPAGTTATAIDILQQQGFDELIFNAMAAAYERAKQLGLT